MNSNKQFTLEYKDGHSVTYSLGSMIKHVRHNGERPIKCIFHFNEDNVTNKEQANIDVTISYLDAKIGVVEYKG